MILIVALLRIALGFIFGVAGVTKLLDQRGTREAVVNFGAPKSFAPLIAIALPITELLVVIGLPFSSTAWWSALMALVLLGVFVIAISVNLAQGRTHDCHCFGQLHSRPLGWPTLVRNMVFAMAAVLVLWWFDPQTSPPLSTTITEAFAGLGKVEVGLLVAALAAAAGAFFYSRKRQKENAAKQTELPEGLPLDSPAPQFELPAYDGGNRSLTQLLEFGKPLMLLFTNPACGPCVHLFQEIRDWQRLHGEKLTIALVSRGSIKDNFVSVAKNGLGEVLLQETTEVAQLYSAQATPTAVVISPGGRIASNVAAGGDEIRKLLESTLN